MSRKKNMDRDYISHTKKRFYDDDNDNDFIMRDEIREEKCNNPKCDHRYNKKYKPDIEDREVKSIDDLIYFGYLYHCKNLKDYKGINLKILFDLIEPLSELTKLIGMQEVKENMVNQIIFFLQKLNVKTKCNTCHNCLVNITCKNTNNNLNDDMLHTIVSGPPGVGKTELGKILGKVYKAMGILSTGDFFIAKRADLIAKYLGHTAPKTQAFIDKCKGGVMFIDEAYSLGEKETRDSFAKECLDTLNQNLSERRDFLCIIAGYDDALDQCFFSYNEGLKRRFSFKYTISCYSGEELAEIFLLKIKLADWDFVSSKEDLNDFFKKNKDKFPRFGGDMETLFLKTKITHARRIFFKTETERKKITIDDIKKGFENFHSHRKSKEPEEIPEKIMSMYI
jgi:SpoVK/Ycf46/Vps4 family AAA+-type ATPase